ncbi:NAD(P)H-binding protein [Streptomyces sp. HNM0574]|uniref:NAD(P)H-binding protein n=1 Tax=Streptomyces sp. HNM0574 TaxID=2714954 RepID=UPI00146EC1C8|nr:NAD(P)H-binding protein [Streptomyces sp. HNM0574]NLU68552.1 NAD(P)H-binding protein [Streptomyces sp. HNM0574]
MAKQQRVLVTGATGNVGPHAVAQLLDAGVETRALVLENDPNSDRIPPGAEVFHGSLADPDSLDACLEGVDAVFLMWPFFTLDVDTVPAVLEKLEKHTRRVVFISSIGVHIGLEPVGNRCHAYLEQQIEKTSLEWTFLQTTGFACNTRIGWAAQLKESGVMRSPYGEAARSPIHEADVAAVAVRALTRDGHAGRRYVVTGPEALPQIDQLAVIAEVTGRDLRWEDVPADAAKAAMVEVGWPESYAAGALDYFAMLVKEPETVTDHVAQVLGRAPRTFREWVTEHADDFR